MCCCLYPWLTKHRWIVTEGQWREDLGFLVSISLISLKNLYSATQLPWLDVDGLLKEDISFYLQLHEVCTLLMLLPIAITIFDRFIFMFHKLICTDDMHIQAP